MAWAASRNSTVTAWVFFHPSLSICLSSKTSPDKYQGCTGTVVILRQYITLSFWFEDVKHLCLVFYRNLSHIRKWPCFNCYYFSRLAAMAAMTSSVQYCPSRSWLAWWHKKRAVSSRAKSTGSAQRSCKSDSEDWKEMTRHSISLTVELRGETLSPGTHGPHCLLGPPRFFSVYSQFFRGIILFFLQEQNRF